MFDQDTMIITYDNRRGDPRGSRSRKADPKVLGLGDCIDCGICVEVCPTGIDIRNGLQYECIGCAACADGCDQVMGKMNYPKGLIRYSTDNAVKHHWSRADIWRRAARPRTLIYSAILLLIVSAFAAALWTRVPLKVDVIRDRGALARVVDDGIIENVYRLQIMNTQEAFRRFRITASGIGGIYVASEEIAELPGASAKAFPVRLRLPAAAARLAQPGSNPITFEIKAINHDNVSVREKSVFLLPR